MCLFFFFQAEDGIRDLTVTGVQTCALPISDRHPLPEIEVGHRLLGARHHRVLAGDRRELGHGRFEPLGVLGRVPHSDVEHDLQEPRDLVRVLEPELLRQLGPHPLLVMVEQSRARRGLGRRPFGLRHRLPPPPPPPASFPSFPSFPSSPPSPFSSVSPAPPAGAPPRGGPPPPRAPPPPPPARPPGRP